MELRIKEVRTLKGLTQAELAEAANMRIASISTIESGRGNPTLTTLGRIADVLGVSIRDLLPATSKDDLVSEIAQRLAQLPPETRAAIDVLARSHANSSSED